MFGNSTCTSFLSKFFCWVIGKHTVLLYHKTVFSNLLLCFRINVHDYVWIFIYIYLEYISAYFQILFFPSVWVNCCSILFQGSKTFSILKGKCFCIFIFSFVFAVWENFLPTLSQISLIEVTRISCQCTLAPLPLRPSRIIYRLPRYRLTLVSFLTLKR